MSQRRRAAKYRRISRDREGRQLGIERQDHDIGELAERRHMDVVADYFDNDVSASTISSKPRRGYAQMLADARAGKFEVIIAYTTGRLTRRPREFEDLVDLAKDFGVEFEYVKSPSFDLRTSQGRRIARTLAVQDTAEAEDIAERVTREKLQAAGAGKWLGGRRPFGYDHDGITIRPVEARALLHASEVVLRGASLRSIATDWNRQGLRTSTGGPWRQDTVRRVLLRPRNAGLAEHRGEIVGPAQWEAAVPEHVWRGMLAILEDPARRTQFSSVRRWMGSGLYLCGVCDNGTRVRCTLPASNRANPRPAYMCTVTRHVARVAEEVDRFIAGVVVERLSRPDARNLLHNPDVDTTPLRIEATAIRARLNGLATAYAGGSITLSQLEVGTATLRRSLEDVERQLAAAARESALSGLVDVDDVAGAWSMFDLDRRRAVIAELMTVRLMPSPRGRRRGWRPGESYFSPDTVSIDWQD